MTLEYYVLHSLLYHNVGPCLAKERRMYRIFVGKVKPTVLMSEKSKQFRE
jgi:hypothetical protein